MSTIETVLSICQRLEAAGKKPSMGLIKARSSVNIPLPIIISGISRFNEMSTHEKEAISDAPAQPTPELSTDDHDTRIRHLEQQVKHLSAELQALKSQL